MAIVAHHRRTRADGRPEIYSSDPFCPTLASSWNQISIGLPLQPTRATPRLPELGKFCLKVSWALGSFFRMIGAAVAAASAEAGAAARFRPCASATLTDQRDAISACRSAQRQRNTTLLRSRSGAFQHHGPKLLHLRLVQRQRASGAATRTQSGHAFRVVAQHPVMQCLPIHAVQHHCAAASAWMALQHQCYCRKRRTTAPACVRAASSLSSVAESSKRVISIGLPIRLHSLRDRRDTQRGSHQADLGISPGRVDHSDGWYYRRRSADGTRCGSNSVAGASLASGTLFAQALADGGGTLDMLQMIDSTIVRAHRVALPGKGPRSKIRHSVVLAVGFRHQDPCALQRRRFSPSGSCSSEGEEAHDVTAYDGLMQQRDSDPGAMLADKSYDSDKIRNDLRDRGATTEIPSRSNRKVY